MNRKNAAAKRLTRFQQRPVVRLVTSQYADWSQSSDGIMIQLQLSYLAMARQCGELTRQQYNTAIHNLALSSGIPIHDFRILARCSVELLKCTLAGSGIIPLPAARPDGKGDDE